MVHQSSGPLYAVRNGNGNGDGLKSDLFLITGHNLAHAHRTSSERAAIAAQLVLGEAEMVKPTITQVVPAARVSVPYVHLALHLKPETRALVAMGELSLSDAGKEDDLLAAWLKASPAKQAAFRANLERLTTGPSHANARRAFSLPTI